MPSSRTPLIVHVFPSFAVGGAQVRFAAIANHFGNAFRHIVVALDGDLGCRDHLRPDLDVTFPQLDVRPAGMLADAWRFRRKLRHWQPDLLITHNWGAISGALANIRPLARHLHLEDGFGPEERTRQIPRRVRLRRIVLRRTPVVVPSHTLHRIATEIWKLPPRFIHYVPNGIELQRFAPEAETTDGVAPEPEQQQTLPVIGTVAALREEKNLPRLLHAFARLVATVPARLVVVGDGPCRGELAALADELGIADRVEFAGYSRDTPAFYAGFDVFALSSDTEQMPLSVIEAMASGLAVVATDVGDVRTMVSAENAPFITALDDAAFATALRALTSNTLLRYRIGSANRLKARRDFDAAAMFAAHGALWRGTAGAS